MEQEKTRDTTIKETRKEQDTIDPQENSILEWRDNIIGEEIEEIFDFLTKEKSKFLSGYNSSPNHVNTNSLHTDHLHTPGNSFDRSTSWENDSVQISQPPSEIH